MAIIDLQALLDSIESQWYLLSESQLDELFVSSDLCLVTQQGYHHRLISC